MAGLLRRRRSTVTVVVRVTDANAPFLDECLHSLASQQRGPDEVLLAVDGGAGADSRALVGHAAGSWTGGRSTLTTLEGSVDEALRGVAGTFVMVLEAGDLLAPAAVRALATSLDETGAELALPGPEPRPGSTLVSAPYAAATVDLASLMMRTSFWHRAGLVAAQPPLTGWVPAVRAVLRASTFDVVADPVRRGSRRGTGVAFNAWPDVAPHLGEALPLVEELLEELSEAAVRPAREQLVRWLLGHEAPGHLRDAERCDAATWQQLRRFVNRLLDEVPPAAVDAVPVEERTRLRLAAADRRAELEVFNTARWHEDGDYPTVVEDGLVRAVLPVQDLPGEALELSADEAPLVTQLRRARWNDAGGLEVEVVAFTRRVGTAAGAADIRLALVTGAGERLELETTQPTAPEVNVLAGERHHDHADGLRRAVIDPDRLLAGGAATWSLHVTWARAGVRRAAVVSDVERRGSVAALPARRGIAIEPGAATVVVRPGEPDRQPGGGPGTPELISLTLEGDLLVVTGTAPEGPATLRLRGPGGVASVDVHPEAGAFTARLPMRHDPWSTGPTTLPPGGYRLRLVGGAGDGLGRLVLGTPLAARTPYVERSGELRLRVERNPDGSAQLLLGPPLADDEVGPHAQQELRRWYATDEHRLDPNAVYLQSYNGSGVTDSPLAIHRELRRARPDLRLVWGAADASVVVPEGAERVQVRSRGWYAALATCGSIVTNTDMDEWFRKRPGQRLLQTFHGYPAKAMGVMAWEAKNHPRSLVERQLRRTAGTWDLLLTPHPAMDVHYREQYRYAGPILSAGYPRDDELVGPDAARLREETRARLGIGDRKAVLYAPTWRDDLTTSFRAAVLPSTFDVEGAAAALGEEYVILLRGHRFHRRRPDVGDRLLDVTAHPEVNHLVLAADAAVLDYSSLRFDVALTGSPMVFLVPDLDRYASGVRGFLYDFRSSAPGPLVDTTAEVVEALRDLDRLRRRHREEHEHFHRQFNSLQDGRAAERVVQTFFG